jgi:hypothetical protein
MIDESGAGDEMLAESFPASQAVYLDSHGQFRVTLWRKCILWMVGSYLILNAGFEMVRIPPAGAGIPVGELALILSFFILNPLTVVPRMSRQVWLFPILVWWMLALPRSLFDATVNGVWSLRDASQAIESLYLIVGFALVNSVDNMRYFISWLRKLLPVMAIYGLVLPFSKSLQVLSPSLPGISSGSTKLFFQTTNSATLMLWSAAWLLLHEKRSDKEIPWRLPMAAFLVAYAAAFGQSRGLYLQILLLGVLFFFLRMRTAVKWYATLAFGCLMIAGIAATGLGLTGRTGHKISLDYIVRHLESTSGTGEVDTQDSAEGVGQRIGWWSHVYSEMGQSAYNEAFGLGYGIALTDFHGGSGKITREPHNSYISVWARLGYTGAAVWLLMQAGLYRSWWRSFKLAKRFGWIHAQNNLLFLLVFFFFMLIAALGEDAFEKPFGAIPYYLFFGVVLRYGMLLREEAQLQY